MPSLSLLPGEARVLPSGMSVTSIGVKGVVIDSVAAPAGDVLRTAGEEGLALRSPLALAGSVLVPGEELPVALQAALAELGIWEKEAAVAEERPAAEAEAARTAEAGDVLRGAGAGPGAEPGMLAGASAVEEALVFRPQPPAEAGAAQVMLYQDEARVLSWHLPDALRGADKADGDGDVAATAAVTFTIPLGKPASAAVAAAAAAGGVESLRGPITRIGRKIFRVLVLPVLSPLVGAGVQKLVAAVERKHRQDLVRPLTPVNYKERVTTPLTAADWKRLRGGRALLVIHGIFSTTEGMLSLMPEPFMKMLEARYEGRMIALDQMTVSRSPLDNAQFFLDEVKAGMAAAGGGDGKPLEFDILCHSRGGIVTRTLVERGEKLAPGVCTFKNVFFVAAPNQGARLADRDHLVDLLDVYTNFATKIPDGMTAYVLETILAILKMVVHGAAQTLPGLRAMETGAEGYIAGLNKAGVMPEGVRYAAAAAEFEPAAGMRLGRLIGRVGDVVLDRVYVDAQGKAMANDLVVPTGGVFEANGHPAFPIPRVKFEKESGVCHVDFFGRREVLFAIKEHFGLRSDQAEEAMGSLRVTAGAKLEFSSSTLKYLEKLEEDEGPRSFVDARGQMISGSSTAESRGAADSCDESFRDKDADAPPVLRGSSGSGVGTTGPKRTLEGGTRRGGAVDPGEKVWEDEPKPTAKGGTRRGGEAPPDEVKPDKDSGGGRIKLRPDDFEMPPLRVGFFQRFKDPQLEAAFPFPSMDGGLKSGQEELRSGDDATEPATDAGQQQPTTTPTAAPATLRRDPSIKFRDEVKEGEVLPLVVSLEEITAQSLPADMVEIALVPGETEAKVLVTLDAPGFDVEPSAGAMMTVKTVRDARTEKVLFMLTALAPGSAPVKREISADFWVGHAAVGAVTHATVVVPNGHGGEGLRAGAAADTSRSDGFHIPAERRRDCDLLIQLQGRNEPAEAPFRVNLSCNVPGFAMAMTYCGDFALGEKDDSLEKHLAEVYTKIFETYPTTAAGYEAWVKQANRHLNGLGVWLWERLPDTFRHEYFRLQDGGAQIKSIFVHSAEMIFPWELVIPLRPGEDARPENRLGLRHILGRWQPGRAFRPEPQRMRVERFCVLNPVYAAGLALPAAQDEADKLRALYPKATIIRPGTLAEVEAQLLDRKDTHLFHFSGHGAFKGENADLSELLLAGAHKIDALMFNTWSFDMKGGPLVFLNACQVGSAGTVVGRSGGFAATFLARGCSGVIAPYWPVEDRKASEFALSLYAKLATGMVIGQALQELRAEHPERPSYTAFAYFGDPYASLDMSGLHTEVVG